MAADEGKKAEEKAAAAAPAPAIKKEGVDIAAAAAGASGGSTEEVEGEDDAEVDPKVSNTKMNSALQASRSPYAKPRAAGERS